MSWDELNASVGAKTPTSQKAQTWADLNEAAKPRAKMMNFAVEQEDYDAAAKRANSIGTLTKETIKGTLSSIPTAFKAGVDQVKQGYGQLTGSGQSLTQRGEGLLNLGAGVVNAASAPLAPITAPIGQGIEMAGEQLAKTEPFRKFGEANPQNGILTPLERGVGAVVNATTIAGAAAPILKKPVVPTRNLSVTSATPEAAAIPVKKTVPVLSRQTEPTRVNVNTPYLTPDQMPTIQMGERPKPRGIDVNDLEAPVSPKTNQDRINALSKEDRAKVLTDTRRFFGKGFSYDSAQNKALARFESMKQGGAVTNVVDAPVVKKPVLSKIKLTVPSNVKTPVLSKSSIETKVVPIKTNSYGKLIKQPVLPTTKLINPQKTGLPTKVARRISDSLVKQGFDELPPEAQSKYTPTSYKQTAQNVANEMASDLSTVIKMAKGELPLSKKLNGHGQILLNAVEKYAVENGDAALLQDLAKSPIGKERSLAAQRLGESGYNANPYSPLAAIDEVNRVREAAVTKRTKVSADNVVKEIRQSMKRQKPDWNNFIDSLKC